MATDVDIAIVGAGPAGLMAATMSAQAGARVLLLERNTWAGGRLGLQSQPLQGLNTLYKGLTGQQFCRQMVDDATSAGVDISLGSAVTEVHSLPEEPRSLWVSYRSADGGDRRVQVRAAILATGSNESEPEFPGGALSGVMPAGEAQVSLNVHSRLPGRRVLMVGSDDGGLLIAANLRDAGAVIVAVVEESPEIVGREANAAPLRDAGVPILTSTRVVEASGSVRVESATIADVDSATRREVEVDTICVAGLRTPETDLARKAGCAFLDLPILGGPVPVHHFWMGTTVLRIGVCGDGAGVENGAVSIESGRLAGLLTADILGHGHPELEALESLAQHRLGYLRRGRRGRLRREAKKTMEAEHEKARRRGARRAPGLT